VSLEDLDDPNDGHWLHATADQDVPNRGPIQPRTLKRIARALVQAQVIEGTDELLEADRRVGVESMSRFYRARSSGRTPRKRVRSNSRSSVRPPGAGVDAHDQFHVGLDWPDQMWLPKMG
jgi:hypothetical protein